MNRSIYFSSQLFGIALVLTGCMIVRAPSVKELHSLDRPPIDVVAKIEKLFPQALEWYDQVEGQLSPIGRPLSETELAVARKLKVLHPKHVRVVVLARFPMPENRELRVQAQRYGMGSYFEGGRTFGYVIMLKPRYADNLTVISHELVHVSQYDRLGRAAFVRRYLVEMEIMGYARSPLELEAYQKQGVSQ